MGPKHLRRLGYLFKEGILKMCPVGTFQRRTLDLSAKSVSPNATLSFGISGCPWNKQQQILGKLMKIEMNLSGIFIYFFGVGVTTHQKHHVMHVFQVMSTIRSNWLEKRASPRCIPRQFSSLVSLMTSGVVSVDLKGKDLICPVAQP